MIGYILLGVLTVELIAYIVLNRVEHKKRINKNKEKGVDNNVS